MNAPNDSAQVVRAFPAWADRWEKFRSTGYWRAALLTISEDAEREGIKDLACSAYDAATVADAGERADFICDVEEWFAEDARREADEALAYALERNPNYGIEHALLSPVRVPPQGARQ